MKIKVLTYTNSINYGALLQAYALSDYLNKNGHLCEVIDYENPKRKFSQVKGFFKLRSIFWHYLSKPFQNHERNLRTKFFKNKYIVFTKKTYKKAQQLRELNDNTDIFIVGSDQVWNKLNNANDSSYFLNFTEDNKKRIAFAASFGTNDVSEDYLDSVSFDLKRFDLISVREKNAVDILKKINIKSIPLCDPVFLKPKTEWENLANNSELMISYEFVLCYVMPGSSIVVENIKKVANSIAKKNGIKVISIGEKISARSIYGESIIHSCGPLEFLYLIKNSNFVVTNSFHGTAFSIIFNKQFCSVLKKSYQTNNRNIRLENLLEELKLENRLVYTDGTFDLANALKPINYQDKSLKYNEMCNNAKEFLNGLK